MTRLIQCGLGSMGSLMARIALEKRDVTLVGAVCRRAQLHGSDLADYLGEEAARGVKIFSDFASAQAETSADVAITAASSLLPDEIPIIESAVAAGLNVVSIAEEMAYPAAADPAAAQHLDEIARDAGVTVLGTGINPGFVLDLLIIVFTGICRRVDSIYAERFNDLSPYGGAVMTTQGIGLTPGEFDAGLKDGSVLGHIGFQQSVAMIADALGWTLERTEETRAPIVAAKERRGEHITVPAGKVAGCRHTAQGFVAGSPRIELVHPQQIQPGAEGQKTWDLIRVEGEPRIEMRVEPEMAGGTGTASIAVNMVPLVAAAAPGLVSMKDLPVPRLAALKASS
jgi:2,4-diaminopentanoate dehydrogenase